MMTNHEQREQRWIAYFLGEGDPVERRRTEQELREAPEEAERIRVLCTAVTQWAQEEVPPSPLALSELPVGDLEFQRAKKQRTSAMWKALPWAAAAVFLLALSQVSFSVTMGDTTFAWGAGGAPQTADPAIATRLATLETASAEANELASAVALRTMNLETELRDTAAELAQNQRLESEVRYRDMARLLTLLSPNSGYPAEFASLAGNDN
jgi:hypothetical protein